MDAAGFPPLTPQLIDLIVKRETESKNSLRT
jgi:hypothetical protein